MARLIRNRLFPQVILVVFCLIGLWLPNCKSSTEAGADQNICRPILGESPGIELGKAGQFEWTCVGGQHDVQGYYIVFVRPAGTYVLLKVPQGRTSFEFTPDVEGIWRWIVINTDPDRTKPDLESEAGYFRVITTDGH